MPANVAKAEAPTGIRRREDMRLVVRYFLECSFTAAEASRLFRKMLIEEALILARGNQCRAAKNLGMHRNTLSRAIYDLKIDPRFLENLRSENLGRRRSPRLGA